jgi:pyridoxamine 5'-phosphate oxidase
MAPLHESDLHPDPIEQFRRWFDQALAAQGPRADAAALATATPDGVPSVRMVLLKGVDARGFVFYTNDRSTKGHDLAANPRAAMAFYWPALHRQVRVAGPVRSVTREESDAYWRTRPREARLAAAASDQSAVLPDRETLHRRFRELSGRHPGEDVPRPDHWRGFRIAPEAIEFWQGHEHRLHDRLRYRADGTGGWRIERLAP